MVRKVKIEIDEPSTCGKCPFYSSIEYSCHNERGYEAHCALGFMNGDMRDKSYRDTRWKGCKLGEELYSG